MAANCTAYNGSIDITELTIEEAHQIKIALIHFAKKNLPNTTREERSFNQTMVTKIDKAQHEYCCNLEKQGVCM